MMFCSIALIPKPYPLQVKVVNDAALAVEVQNADAISVKVSNQSQSNMESTNRAFAGANQPVLVKIDGPVEIKTPRMGIPISIPAGDVVPVSIENVRVSVPIAASSTLRVEGTVCVSNMR